MTDSNVPQRGSIATETDFFMDSEMGVGTWAWGDRLFWGYGQGYNQVDLKQVFDLSLTAGMRVFDTAEVYGQGQSERLLGAFIREAQAIEPRILVATKFMPFPWRLGRQSLLRALRGSLERLGLPFVDLYQIHQALPPVTPESWMLAMTEAVQAGLTRAVGVSNYSRDWTQRAYDTLIREGVTLASNQVEYSLLNRKIEKNGLLKQCNELGVKVIAYSPLAMGMLTGKYTVQNPPKGVRAGRYNRKLLERITPLINLMLHIGQNHDGKTPAQIALNWCICKGTFPIPGAKTITQVEQNTGALGWRLTEDEVADLDEVSDRVAP